MFYVWFLTYFQEAQRREMLQGRNPMPANAGRVTANSLLHSWLRFRDSKPKLTN